MNKAIKMPKKKYIETIFARKGKVTNVSKKDGFWLVDVTLKQTAVIFGSYNAFTLISATPSDGQATFQADNERLAMYMDVGIMYKD